MFFILLFVGASAQLMQAERTCSLKEAHLENFKGQVFVLDMLGQKRPLLVIDNDFSITVELKRSHDLTSVTIFEVTMPVKVISVEINDNGFAVFLNGKLLSADFYSQHQIFVTNTKLIFQWSPIFGTAEISKSSIDIASSDYIISKSNGLCVLENLADLPIEDQFILEIQDAETCEPY